MIRKIKLTIAIWREWATFQIIFSIISMFLAIISLSVYIFLCCIHLWLLVFLPIWYMYIVSIVFTFRDGMDMEYIKHMDILNDTLDIQEQRDKLRKIIKNQKKLLESGTKVI